MTCPDEPRSPEEVPRPPESTGSTGSTGSNGHEAIRQENLRRVVAAEAQGDTSFDALPLRLTMELSIDCNLRCPHCEFTPPRVWANKLDPRPPMELPVADLERVAEAVFPYIQTVIPSVVGEPMMYSHWERFLALMETYGVYADICTNGTYLDRPTLDRMNSRTTRITVSMDGASPATFNKLRAPADFDEVVARLRELARWRRELAPHERPEVWITSVLMLQWIDELPDMVRLAAELELNGVTGGFLVALNKHWEASHPSVEPERTNRALREAGRVARELGVSLALPQTFDGEDVSHIAEPLLPIQVKVPSPPRPDDERPYWCKYIWRELFVSFDGDVSSCCGTGRPVIGNLRRDFDLKKFFHDPVVAGMRQGMLDGNLHQACRACPQLAMFGGGTSYGEAVFRDEYGALEGFKSLSKGGPPQDA